MTRDQIKERPILFSAPMVRAILDGSKTQTRRVVKGWQLEWLQPGQFTPEYLALPENDACPYGQPGERLWVREAWGYIDPDCTGEDYDEPEGPAPKTFCDKLLQNGHPLRDFWRRRVTYRASWHDPKYGIGPDAPKRWRPSIHMPRWASRITLEITGVRVERLQDISEADAQAEGIGEFLGGWACLTDDAPQQAGNTPQEGYRHLWEQINGPDSWAANPWVWVVEFRRIVE